jgi:hypothetical protein
VWTRSLIPAMIAHALFDIPMTLRWQALFLAVMMIVALIAARRAGLAIKQVFSGRAPPRAQHSD